MLTAADEFRFSPRPNRAAEIAWEAWDESSFRRARSEDKPVLLSISAVWCHWCHVMDETSYSDPAVIALINERYVAIRVDADRRPDVNARYNMGGWPTTAVLTPDGETITGATYLAPAQMRDFLDDIAAFFRTEQATIEVKLTENRARAAAPHVEPGTLSAEPIGNVVESIVAGYDEEFGGFGSAPEISTSRRPRVFVARTANCSHHGRGRHAARPHARNNRACDGAFGHVRPG